MQHVFLLIIAVYTSPVDSPSYLGPRHLVEAAAQSHKFYPNREQCEAEGRTIVYEVAAKLHKVTRASCVAVPTEVMEGE